MKRVMLFLLLISLIFLSSCMKEEMILTYDSVYVTKDEFIENADYIMIVEIISNSETSDETLFQDALPLTTIEIIVIQNLKGEYDEEFLYHMGGYEGSTFIGEKYSAVYKNMSPNIISKGIYVIASYNWGEVTYPVIQEYDKLQGYDVALEPNEQRDSLKEILDNFGY